MRCPCGAVFFQLNLLDRLIHCSNELISTDFRPQNILLKIWLMSRHFFELPSCTLELHKTLFIWSCLLKFLYILDNCIIICRYFAGRPVVVLFPWSLLFTICSCNIAVCFTVLQCTSHSSSVVV